MKKLLSLLLVCAMAASLAACGNSNNASQNDTQGSSSEVQQETSDTQETENLESEDEEMEETKRVASDGAQMQTDDPSKPTRVLEEGTRINMHFGDTVIPGILNDSTTAQAFIEMLPMTVHESRYSHDFCGSMDDFLPFDEEDERYGWLNGDIAIGTNVPWFTILFDDEDISEQYGNLVNIGVIDCDLSAISDLNGSYDVLIELAE
ncbi:cyclophilin-like fold protein [Enterocloster bolteae]|uniref:cyclophilin-like fold protein n=1 Tax=Enterocloster bolteae TaxID=208479 RepID=UPI0028DB5641|nr:cyclophilin-like fold protein [Enterocloster bolteae]